MSNVNLVGKALEQYQAVVCQKLKREKGMSIRQIAKMIGLSHTTVWRRLMIPTPVSQGRWCNFQYRKAPNE